MVITKSFNLDINTPWKAPTLYIKQGDADSRKLQATIRRDGVNYTIPGDVAASFRMKKPDGTIVTQDCTISGSVVSVVMDAQCATAAGHAKAEIVLATAGEVVSTFLLAIEVMPAAVTDGDIESHDALGEYRTILEEMLRVKGAPLTANTAADMTDTDRVYVYTGSEVGYVNGDWYYYDGDSWEVGGVYNSQAIADDFLNDITQMVKQSAVASESDSVPYLFRPTPNPSAILADEEIVGGTVAWNQLQGQTTSRTNAGITYTYNSTDGTLHVAGTASAASYWESGSTGFKQDYFANHVYLLLAGNESYAGSGSTYRLYFAQTAFSPRYADTPVTMAKPNASGNNYLLQVAVYSGTTVDITLRLQLFDLTAKFGTQIADYLYTLESGTAGAGVAKLREWGFLSKEYFAYDAGSLKSVNTEGKRVVGKNLFTGTWESGSYGSAGNKITDATKIRTVSAIAVEPNTTYTLSFTTPRTATGLVCYYDPTTFISRASIMAGASTFTTPANCTRVNFAVKLESDGTTPKAQMELGSIATSYVPYHSTLYPTTPTDLNGIFYLDENNQLRTKGDVYHPNGTIDRKYGIVDLGTCTWVTSGTTNVFYTSSVQKAYGNDNLLSTKYPTSNEASIANMDDHTIKGNAGNRTVYIKDSAYNSLWVANDVAAFKTAMSGVYLVYEKTTPTTDTADPYTATQIVGKGGTEEWIDSRSVPVPVGHRTQYSIGVPDVPASGSNLVLKATASGGKTTLKWE